jgi:tRNA U54 and U55 pseudouridine synthase Pus10
MSAIAEIKVDVKREDGKIRWNHLYLIEKGDVKSIFIVFDTEGDEIYIQYDTVSIFIKGKYMEYELTHEEEEAVKGYISENYEFPQ